MGSFDSNKVLPKSVCIESAANILCQHGLYYGNELKLKFYQNPILLFILFIIVVIKNTINAMNSEQNAMIIITLGDFTHFLGIRLYFNIALNLFTILIINSQLIYYYNYKTGVKPTFLYVFEMMSGKLSPKSVGLTDPTIITNLLRITKMLVNIIQFNNQIIIPIFAFIVSMVPIITNFTFMQTIIFGIPSSLLFIVYAYCAWNVMLYQLAYFHILCFYLKLKIIDINNKLKVLSNTTNSYQIYEQLVKMDLLYKEINEYNTTYWSKFLLSFWLTYGSATILLLYIIIFIEMSFYIKFIYIYAFIVFGSIFLFIIFKASSINLETFKSYYILNNLLISLNQKRIKRLAIKFKVCIFNFECYIKF